MKKTLIALALAAATPLAAHATATASTDGAPAKPIIAVNHVDYTISVAALTPPMTITDMAQANSEQLGQAGAIKDVIKSSKFQFTAVGQKAVITSQSVDAALNAHFVLSGTTAESETANADTLTAVGGADDGYLLLTRTAAIAIPSGDHHATAVLTTYSN